LGQDSSQTGQADYYLAQVSSASLYYPFGWEMPGRKFVSGEEYRFGFNGVEQEDEVSEGSYTTTYRSLDTRVGRWRSVDPVKHHSMSPYNSMDNNPISGYDPDGRDTRVKKKKRKGKEHIEIRYRGVIIDKTDKGLSRSEIRKIRNEIKAQLKKSFSGESGDRTWDIKVKLRIGKSSRKFRRKNSKGQSVRESTITLANEGYQYGEKDTEKLSSRGGMSLNNGYDAFVSLGPASSPASARGMTASVKTAVHEAGHTMGLPHIVENIPINTQDVPLSAFGFVTADILPEDKILEGNLMMNGPFAFESSKLNGTKVIESQILHIAQDYDAERLNLENEGGGSGDWGIYKTDTPVYKLYYSKFTKKSQYHKKQ